LTVSISSDKLDGVKFRFKDRSLERLYYEGHGKERYPKNIVDRFFRIMQLIHDAKDERDMRNWKSLHYEKLKEKKWKGCYSIALDKTTKYRLIIEKITEDEGISLLITEINDRHYG